MAKKAQQPVRPTPKNSADTHTTVATNYAWVPWVVGAAAFLLYATGFSNKMLAMDDHSATVDNAIVKDFSLAAFGHFNLGMYAPLTWMGYAIAWGLGKSDPFWYHFLSALVHAINAVLAFRLLSRLVPTATGQFPWVAGFVAMAFALHPVQVEAVSWIAGFSTPLFSLFYLLALLYYEKNEQSSAGKMGANYWLSAGMFLLACLCKSAAVTLPLTMLVLDFWQKRPINLQNMVKKAPFWAISIAFGLLTIFSRGEAGHKIATMSGEYSLLDRFLMVGHTLLFYWGKLLLPLGLSAFYPFERSGGAWPTAYWVAPVVLLGIAFFAWKMRAKMPFLAIGLLFWLSNVVLALPYYTIGTFELRSDRYNYLGAIGIFFLLAALAQWAGTQRPTTKPIAWSALGLLTAFWLFTSIQRIGVWKDTITLVTDAIEQGNHNNGKAYYWRGVEYFKRNTGDDLSKALNDFNAGLKINPDQPEAYKYRGILLGMGRKYEQSVADLSRYLEANPNDGDAFFNRGITFAKLNRHAEAIQDFSKTIALMPNFADPYGARANSYAALGDTVKADADRNEYAKRAQR